MAKLILDSSNKPLSLRRVPPNALVGEGAKVFAEENGITTCPNEHLVSKSARDRFIRWQMDLHRAEFSSDSRTLPTPNPGQPDCSQHRQDTSSPAPDQSSRLDHSAAILAATWNEGQPNSPAYGTPEPSTPGGSSTPIPLPQRAHPQMWSRLEINEHNVPGDHRIAPAAHTPQSLDTPPVLGHDTGTTITNQGGLDQQNLGLPASDFQRPYSQWDSVQHGPPSSSGHSSTSRGAKRPHSREEDDDEESKRPSLSFGPPFHPRDAEEDIITDTIGAIAIDENGNIAAGSSSGGIGMKHRGRLGPAALVGVGTAVIPCAEEDEDNVSVAAVTSGTGEHMVTTMASQRCAERLYFGNRKGKAGQDIQDDDEDAIMESFVVHDFMGHPGVKNCHSAAAIGVMAVKKTPRGHYLYFAHNTESFALASMGGLDKQPVCTMSRLSKGARIAKGGLKVRVD